MRVETDRPFVGNQCQEVDVCRRQRRDRRGQSRFERLGPGLRGRQTVRGIRLGRESTTSGSAEKPADVWVSLESGDGEQILAEARLGAATADWSRLDFTLTPTAAATGWAIRRQTQAARQRSTGPRLSPAWLMGPIQEPAGPPRRGRRDDRSRDHGASLRRLDGQQCRISLEENDRPARPPAPLSRPLVSLFEQRLGNRRLCRFLRGGRISLRPGLQHGRDAPGHGRLRRICQRTGRQPLGPQRVAAGHPRPIGLRFIELGNEERGRRKICRQVQGAGRSHLGQRSRHDARRRRLRLWPADYRSFEYRRGRLRHHDPGGSRRNIKVRQSPRSRGLVRRSCRYQRPRIAPAT